MMVTAIVIVLTVMATISLFSPESALARRCKANEQYGPKWGCVLKSEFAKAWKNCAKLPNRSPFTECLCQDGTKMGACGD